MPEPIAKPTNMALSLIKSNMRFLNNNYLIDIEKMAPNMKISTQIPTLNALLLGVFMGDYYNR